MSKSSSFQLYTHPPLPSCSSNININLFVVATPFSSTTIANHMFPSRSIGHIVHILSPYLGLGFGIVQWLVICTLFIPPQMTITILYRLEVWNILYTGVGGARTRAHWKNTPAFTGIMATAHLFLGLHTHTLYHPLFLTSSFVCCSLSFVVVGDNNTNNRESIREA